MPDREKVIAMLERYVRIPNLAGAENYGTKIVDMPAPLITDALALLKAQQPRVMTLEEVKAFEWDYCYLEQERLPGKEYRMIAGDYALTCITWPNITSMRIEYGDSSYGVKWRCWTSRPTNEQRMETPWKPKSTIHPAGTTEGAQ